MSRQRPFGRLTTALVGGCLFVSASQAEQPPAPWSPGAGDEASVAEWAADKFAPVPASGQLDTPPNPFAPPVAGSRYASAAPAPRLTRPEAVPLPADNPLRKTAPGELRIGSSSLSNAAERAFRSGNQAAVQARSPQPLAAKQQPATTAPRIRVGATSVAPPAQEAEPERIAIPVEAYAKEPALPASYVAPKREASPPAPWAEREPIRVASADSAEPAAFETDFQPAALSNRTVQAGGVGRPGPSELEGPQEASLVVEKRAPTEVRIGQPARFAVRVRNTGRGRAENVVLTDQVPAGARLISSNPTAQVDGGRLVWRLGTIESGDNRTVEMRIEPTREGPLGSVATVTMDASASATTTCTRPALAIRMKAAKRVLLGESQLVSIELSNPGTGSATGVMLLGDVPTAVSHPAGSELEFEVGTLEAGETRRIELNLTAEQAGHVTNAVRVVADGDLRADKQIEFDVIAPSLAVSIDGPSKRYLERPASYKIGVDNPGTAPARDVRLVTHLPRGMEFVRANNLGEYDAATHSVFWSLAELPEGERGEVEVVALPVASGDHTLRVQSESAGGLTAEHSHRVAVDGVASLAFEVRDLSDPIGVGDETVYEIRVLNEGTKAAANVRVRVESPAGLRVVAAEGQTAHRITPSQAEFAPLPALEPGQKAAYRVRVTGAEPGDQRVTVLVESDELSRPIRREESTRVFGDE